MASQAGDLARSVARFRVSSDNDPLAGLVLAQPVTKALLAAP